MLHQVLNVDWADTAIIIVVKEPEAETQTVFMICNCYLSSDEAKPQEVYVHHLWLTERLNEELEEPHCNFFDIYSKHMFEASHAWFLIHKDAQGVVLGIWRDVA